MSNLENILTIQIMHFHVAMFAAILALVSVGEAAAIAPRDGKSSYTCDGCSADGANFLCINCVAVGVIL